MSEGMVFFYGGKGLTSNPKSEFDVSGKAAEEAAFDPLQCPGIDEARTLWTPLMTCTWTYLYDSCRKFGVPFGILRRSFTPKAPVVVGQV